MRSPIFIFLIFLVFPASALACSYPFQLPFSMFQSKDAAREVPRPSITSLQPPRIQLVRFKDVVKDPQSMCGALDILVFEFKMPEGSRYSLDQIGLNIVTLKSTLPTFKISGKTVQHRFFEPYVFLARKKKGKYLARYYYDFGKQFAAIEFKILSMHPGLYVSEPSPNYVLRYHAGKMELFLKSDVAQDVRLYGNMSGGKKLPFRPHKLISKEEADEALSYLEAWYDKKGRMTTLIKYVRKKIWFAQTIQYDEKGISKILLTDAKGNISGRK